MQIACWRWATAFGIIVALIMTGFGMIHGIKACGGSDPIFAFEMVRSPADIAALFPNHCRATHAAAQRTGLWVDIGLFVWTYSAFLICGLFALRLEGDEVAKKAVFLGIACVVVAALADQFENFQLLRLLGTLPGEQSTIDILFPAPRIKFALLGAVTVVAGLLHLRQAGWRKVVGAAAVVGGLLSAAGLLFDHHWVLTGSLLGWSALLVAALILSTRSASMSA